MEAKIKTHREYKDAIKFIEHLIQKSMDMGGFERMNFYDKEKLENLSMKVEEYEQENELYLENDSYVCQDCGEDFLTSADIAICEYCGSDNVLKG